MSVRSGSHRATVVKESGRVKMQRSLKRATAQTLTEERESSLSFVLERIDNAKKKFLVLLHCAQGNLSKLLRCGAYHKRCKHTVNHNPI